MCKWGIGDILTCLWKYIFQGLFSISEMADEVYME